MPKFHMPLAFAGVVLSAGIASADVNIVTCEDFIIAIAHDVAVAAELRTGSVEAMEEMVCATAAQLEVPESPQRVLVHVQPVDLHTQVVMFPREKGDN